MSQQANIAVRSMVMGLSASLFALLTLVFLFVAVMLVIAEGLALWIAAFITTGVLAVLALGAGLYAYQKIKQLRIVPEQTVESMKEDLQWARNRMTSNSAAN